MESTKYLWDDTEKRVRKLEIPEQSGFAKAHSDYIKRELKRISTLEHWRTGLTAAVTAILTFIKVKGAS